MAKIDRLRWEAGIAFKAYGVSVGIRMNDPNLLARVQTLLPPGWKRTEKPTVRRLYSLIAGGSTARPGLRRFNLLYAGAARLVRTHDLEALLRQLETELELYIADRASRRTFVHAGVVGWNGEAIMIPGPTHSGKSCLVRALLKAGATYYSDEFAVLDGRGCVHPYPVPLRIRPDRDGIAPMKYGIEELGGAAGTGPLPVGLVLVTRYVNGARFRPREISAGRAVLALLANTLPARRRPERVLDTLSQVASKARILGGTRGEAEEMARQLLVRMETVA
jgi:hypothetical protein